MTKGCVTLCDASPEPQLATTLAPGGAQHAGRSRIVTAMAAARASRSATGTGSLKHTDPVAQELVEPLLELADKRTQRAVIFAQEVEHLVELECLREGGLAARIAKQVSR